MNINELLDYMYGLKRWGIKLGLEVTEALLKELGNPHKNLKAIHIAGTNGKGSTAVMICSILRSAGYSVGLYTSPHLVRFNERIKVDDKEITDEELATYVKQIKKVTEEKNIQATFFEFTTALTFLHFSNKKPDYVILETGVGGKLDSTNIVTPKISVITNVSMDHMNYLGNSLEIITKTKSKIIKKEVPFVTAETKESVIKIFKKECENNNSAYYNTNDLYNIRILESNLERQRFTVDNYEYEMKLLGEHQVQNASIAIKVSELLGIDKKYIAEGLKKTYWPGRMEIVSKEPFILMDCAHNVEGMKKLKAFLEKNIPKVFLILGMSEDKEHEKMIELIKPFAEKAILTKGNFKPTDPKRLKELLGFGEIIDDPNEAVKKAIKEANNLPILITGSIYLVGDTKKSFQ